VKKIKNIDISR